MKSLKQYAYTALLSATLLLPIATIGCGASVGVGYRYYDPYRADYHVWDANEGRYYNQWTVETHRPSRDFHRLKKNDQEAYWHWRHDHP